MKKHFQNRLIKGGGLVIFIGLLSALVTCRLGLPEVQEEALGAVGSPIEPTQSVMTPQSHLGPGSIDIVPASSTSVGNCIPFGNNTSFGFTGFIYRNVPAFNLAPGGQFAFDLGQQNDVDIRRNIYFAVANTNPGPAVVVSGNVVSQGISALGWTKVASDTQTPQNPKGNTISGDYELIYTAEASFSFPGGGFIVGVGASPPGAYADGGCDQVLVRTVSGDASGQFYSRFFFKADQDLGVLDNITSGGTASELGGIVILASTNDPPEANAGPDQPNVEQTSLDGASVTLDGSGSSDPDAGDVLTYTWREGTTIIAGPTTSSTSNVMLNLGTHTIELEVDDGNGETDTDTVDITVEDTTDPVIAGVSASPDTLWPPNHKMHGVTVSVSVSDICDADVDCEIISVSSNEPVNGLGDGTTDADWEITSDLTVDLRAERSGTGTDRVYTITVECTDDSGNTSMETVDVTVPHDQGKGKKS